MICIQIIASGLKTLGLVLVWFLCSMAVWHFVGGLAMKGLAFLSSWLKCCQLFVSRSSVPLYKSPLYNWPLPGASLASVLSTKHLQFLEVGWIPEELWHLAHVPLLCKRAVEKIVLYATSPQETGVPIYFHYVQYFCWKETWSGGMIPETMHEIYEILVHTLCLAQW